MIDLDPDGKITRSRLATVLMLKETETHVGLDWTSAELQRLADEAIAEIKQREEPGDK